MDTEPSYELHKAAFEGNLELLKELLDSGDHDVNGFDKHGNTPLILAIHFKRNDIVNELLTHGADVGLKNKAGWSPTRYAIASADMPNLRSVHRASLKRERQNLLARLPTMIEALRSVRSAKSLDLEKLSS